MVGNGALIQSETIENFIFPHGLCSWLSYLSQNQEHHVVLKFIHTHCLGSQCGTGNHASGYQRTKGDFSAVHPRNRVCIFIGSCEIRDRIICL